MTIHDVLGTAIAGLAALVFGAVVVVLGVYLWPLLLRGRRVEGRLRIRHVAEVAAGTALLVGALGLGVWATVDTPTSPPIPRLISYLLGMLLLLVGLLDVGNHLRRR